MIFPTIHLNGTSKGELLDQLCSASSAIADAIKALENAGPNGRDYYPQGSYAMRDAQDQHARHVNALVLVKSEIDQIAEHIDGDSHE